MKAVVLERRGADGVEWRDFPDPIPAPGELVMRVVGSSLNRVDLYMRDSGVGITHNLPQVMGVEGAGEIVEAAPGSGLRPGMKVDALFRGVLRQMPLLPRRRSTAVRVRADHGRAPPRRFRGIRGDALALFFPASRRRRSDARGHADERLSDGMADAVRQEDAAARRERAGGGNRRRRGGRLSATRAHDRRARLRDLVERREDRARPSRSARRPASTIARIGCRKPFWT